ncbi:TniQ family protein [Cellulomonas sp. Marseille-Q8402]
MTNPLRLPLIAPPLPGESIVSWLQAEAEEVMFSLPDLLDFLGIPPDTSRRDLLLRLEPEWVGELSELTGKPPEVFTGMTLAGWNEKLQVNGRNAAAVGLGGATTVRFCAECLDEDDGRWPLVWCTPWSFYCTRHDCYLAQRAPRRLLRMWNVRDDLSAVSGLTDWHDGPSAVAVEAQEWLGGRLRDPVEEASDVLTALHLLTTRLIRSDISAVARSMGNPFEQEVRLAQLADHGPDRRGARQGRVALAHQVASPVLVVATEWTRRLFCAPTLGEATEVIRPELEAEMREVPCSPDARLKKWGGRSPTLTAAALPLIKGATATLPMALRFRLSTPTMRWPDVDSDAIEERERRVPAALWPRATASLWRPEYGSLGGFRGAASIALLHVGAKSMSYETAMEHLGTVRRMLPLTRLGDDDRNDVVRSLAEMADAIDSSSVIIDYARRRALDYGTLLPFAEWDIIAQTSRWPSPWRVHPGARTLLRNLMLGEDLSHLHDRASLLFRRLPGPVYESLVRYGERWLGDQGIDEPLTDAGPDLPERSLPDLLGGVRGHEVSVLRLETDPALRGQPARTMRGRPRYTAETYQVLYEEQHLTTYQIAHRLRVSPATVARHLRDAEVDLRARGGGSRPPSTSRFPLHDLPLMQRTLNSDGGLLRVRRFATAVQYPTMSAAAAHLGLNQSSWVLQMQRLERDAGAPLVERAERGRPQHTTAVGETLLAELATLELRMSDAPVRGG